MKGNHFRIEDATEKDLPVILQFIRELAEYERLAHDVVATEESLRETLFGIASFASVLIAFYEDEPAGIAIYFFNYSTFLAKPGLYLEDLFVKPERRGRGIGKALLIRLAEIARKRDCGRFEWSVLDWNEPSIRFYKSLRAVPMEEWTVFRLTGKALAELAEEPIAIRKEANRS